MRAIAMAGAAAAALILAGAGPAGAALLRVTSSADAGDGSLRAAFAKAHAGDRIDLVVASETAAKIVLAAPLPPLASVVVLELRAGAPVVTIAGGAISLAPNGGLSFEIAPGRTVILDAAVSGADGDRGLTLVGGGALVLARPCDYRGGTTVTEATLTLGDGGILPSKGRLTLVAGRLELGPQDAEIGALAGDGGTITLGAKSLTVDQDSDLEFQGAIDGSGRFVKAGAGRLVLKSAIGWTGGTMVSGGVLELAGSGQGVQIHGPIMLQGGALITPGVRLGTGPASGPAQ